MKAHVYLIFCGLVFLLQTVTGLSTGIHKHDKFNTWFLVTDASTYVVGATADGYLLNLHWGARLDHLDNLNATLDTDMSSQDPAITVAKEELPIFGGLRYRENALKIELPDGTRELNLLYAGDANVTGNNLDLHLRDGNHTDLLVTLHYEVDAENDIIRRSYTIRNGLKKSVNISKALSAAWHPPTTLGRDDKRELVTLAGEWYAEANVETTVLRPGVRHVVESTRGFTSHTSFPYFALRSVADEISNGEQDVYFGTLAWSGGWEISAHMNPEGEVRIAGGIQHLDFGWTLQHGESFTTPVFAAGYTNEGMSGARKRMPRHARKYQKKNVKTQQKSHNPVLYNSWEAVSFNVTAEKQLDLVEKAAPLGVELFVIDDGWFGARDNDSAGLGDWYVNKDKFPNGVKPIADRAHALGMKFGIWFEPEGVNPNSDLYRAHPDWAFHYPGIPQYEARNELSLNLGIPEVRDYLYERLHTIIKDNDVDYIKWDMNRPFAEVTMLHNNGRNPREAYVHIVKGYYDLVDRLKKDFPDLLIESCSSGGGRMDMGIVERVDQVWTSDNTRPDGRLFIQYGASLFLPPRVMYGWVTESGDDSNVKIPLSFRFHTSFMGGLGIGSNLNNFNETDMEESKNWIKLYKELRPVIQDGDLDWLVPPSRVGELMAVSQTTAQDQSEAVVLAFRHNTPFNRPIPKVRLRNLEAKHKYQVRVWLEDATKTEDSYEMSGALLMAQGITLPGLNNAMFRSVLVHVKKA